MKTDGAQQINGVSFENYASTTRYGTRGTLTVKEHIDGATLKSKKDGKEIPVEYLKEEHISLTMGDRYNNMLEGFSSEFTVGDGYAVLGSGGGGSFDPSSPLAADGTYKIIDMSNFLLPKDAGGIIGAAASKVSSGGTIASNAMYYGALVIDTYNDWRNHSNNPKDHPDSIPENTNLLEIGTKKVCTVCGDTLELSAPKAHHTDFDTINITAPSINDEQNNQNN